ncbi:acetyl-CoA carboxylase biotin carboxyl carrier protein subunit [Aeoliella sp. ICT_H6.2]|uniref:Acetyl-CoA carboxylase biotin carboxyl carrier protein subunit n=1 Tax=Aeoliella straminimaris TaxID=2954799 RepID=A0A9X2F6Q0_9BACT|nr:acetyl-CoA carboxylase biotin carboxyl carrier protein subunit [Aeoliella straminimaris]MCO6043245.1 acetyl-CoA carboxylase biotin carboxyl carrier protein subunit [Aeoliella straminimaris]
MKKLRITIGDKSYDVSVEVLSDDSAPVTNIPRPAITSSPVVAPAAAAPARPTGAAAPGVIISPMAGMVKAIQVKEGDSVEQGQVLVLLDAMKVENRITAPTAGKVSKILVKEGDTVSEGHVLLEMN